MSIRVRAPWAGSTPGDTYTLAMRRPGAISALILVVLYACSTTVPTSETSAAASGSSRPATSASASVAPTAVASPPDLSARPLVWFAPLPPLPVVPGRPYVGSEDFMGLFPPGASWDRAAARIQVFKLYGEWVTDATDKELRAAVDGISQRGMALAVEMGPLDASAACGQGVESFAGIDEGRLISRRIRQAGGVLQVIALDEPYFYAHVYDGANACHWPVDRVAAAVTDFVRAMRVEWPELIVGDTEPTPVPVTADGLVAWLDAYRAAAGEPFAFLHLDMDWSRSGWPALGLAVERAGAARQVPIGMIYTGGNATSDAQWVSVAGRRVLTYEADAGGHPDHVLFQSWDDKPDHVLPESDPTTFTGLIDRYFDDRSSLAQVPGEPPNLALGKHASASASYQASTPDRAVDGDADTWWSAGAGPPGWIQVDLGAAVRVTEVRLVVSQYPAGKTHHRVSCAATTGGVRRVLADITRTTKDLDVLTVQLVAPVTCRLLRVETLSGPSWVAWREIEVLGSS
jgi:F5/8 type C domain